MNVNRDPVRQKGTAAAAALAVCLLPLAVAISGCTQDGRYQPLGMWNGSRLKPMEQSPMAGLSSSARTPVPGTVARGQLRDDDPVRTGRSGGKLLTMSPVPVTKSLLERGQERYNIYCAPCHSRLGDGEGMIVKRSFPHPPDYAIPRLRKAPVGHFFDVITNGYGVMYSYAERVPPVDRWAISAYIRVLQDNRPVVPVDRWASERVRARETGIHDPRRPMNLDPEAERGVTDPAPPPESAKPGGSGPATGTGDPMLVPGGVKGH